MILPEDLKQKAKALFEYLPPSYAKIIVAKIEAKKGKTYSLDTVYSVKAFRHHNPLVLAELVALALEMKEQTDKTLASLIAFDPLAEDWKKTKPSPQPLELDDLLSSSHKK